MKQLFKVIAPVLTVMFFISCTGNSGNKNENTNDTATHEHVHAGVSKSSAPAADVQLKDDKLNAIYEHYAHLTTALTNADVSAARIAGNAIETGAREITGADQIAAAAAKITSAADIETQRKAYSSLSDDLISLVKKTGVSSGALYVDFCPMAMDDKGAYWLSANKEVKNPYFGEKMMTCGEVKETLQ